MAVGVYGGSFNPVHGGHAHVATTALRRLGLDRVIWLVSPQNPLKSTAGTAPMDERLALTARWASGPSMIVSDLERRIGARYSIDTIRWLKARFPAVRFVWIMGADGLADFHLWRGWAALARELPIAVISRPQAALRSRLSPFARRFADSRVPARAARTLPDRAPPAWIYLEAPYDFTSSTALRSSRLTEGRLHGMEQTVSPCSRSLR
jgi:nicotinate-nucleotide adenylyltransferase